jgi:hypothetical protein
VVGRDAGNSGMVGVWCVVGVVGVYVYGWWCVYVGVYTVGVGRVCGVVGVHGVHSVCIYPYIPRV